ncbi:uncharacterized protein LOC108675677 [Hyalella azteca]|uniref:Uncharacterized protein LOC108675677 n=1 Tax=Hyalella azteca TaxID=294128 RepID=A0A8B7NZL8_HYAAZ|nr:uncharacterized protein LOC108675677 [Hyalella azteca]
MSSNLKADTQAIIKLLQRLQYSGVECTEDAWIQRLLYERSTARDELLQWVVMLLMPDTAAPSWPEMGQPRDQKELLQCLYLLGLCRHTDADLVRGEAPPGQQARFWKLLLTTACGLRRADRLKHSAATELLHALYSSRAIAQVTKDEASSLLPGDFQDKYKAWSRHGKNKELPDVAQSLEETSASLANTLQELNAIPREHHELADSEKLASLTASLTGELDKLATSGELFSQVYTTHLASWLRQADESPLTHGADTGAAVHDAYEKLQRLQKALAGLKEISVRTEELAAAEAATQRLLAQPADVASAVRRIAASARES